MAAPFTFRNFNSVLRADGFSTRNYRKLGMRVINKTGSDIAKDKLVAISGWDPTSKLPKIVLANAGTADLATDVFVTVQPVLNNDTGSVFKGGLSSANLNVGGAVADPVYLNTVNGGFVVTTAPTGTGVRVQIVGYVKTVSATVGQIYWDIKGAATKFGSNDTTGFVAYEPAVNTALFDEFAQTNVTAGTTQTQAGATVLTGQLVEVTVVGTSGDGVALPPARAGLEIYVINHGANPLRVYGNGTDTIDDLTNTVGVLQMANSAVIYACAAAGLWYTEGLATGFSPTTSLATNSFAAAVSAAGANQAAATALTQMMNRVSTVAVGTGVALPAATAGEYIVVDNRGANPLQVYGNNAAGDTINGLATTVGITQPVNSVVTYTCFVAGNWETSFLISGLLSFIALAANSAIAPSASHTYVITKGSIEANTLAAPAASPGGDGINIIITSDTAFAHTLTFTGSLLDAGTASVLTATWAAFKGASLEVVSYNGRWKVLSSNAITFS